MSQWVEIKALFESAPPDWSLFIDAFERHGCPGTQQFDTPPSLVGYLLDIEGVEERVSRLSSDLMRLGASHIARSTVPDEDWIELWKQHFKPRRIGQHFVVRPTWETADLVPGDIEIVLDPGQAFGTGDHPTTRVTLANLEHVPVRGKRLLDLGCGSGILAIAAAKMGADVMASDIDPQSVEVTRENMVRNGVQFPCEVKDGFPEGGPWDVVLSNIISATLVRFAKQAYESVVPGGAWVVSGIIEGNWDDVLKAALRAGFDLEKVEQENEWTGAIFRR